MPAPPTNLPDGGAPGRADIAALFESHRHELLTHYYRMTASLADAEELTQESFLRAWRARDRFRGDASLRTWLYRIATKVCLDFLKSHERRAQPTESVLDTLERDADLDPFPDRDDPASLVAQADTTDLYLTAALLHLPPRQRAAAVARDLLDLSAAESGGVLLPDLRSCPGAWELVPTRANGAPAIVNHVRAPGEETARPISVDVLRTRGGRIVGIHYFLGSARLRAFGTSVAAG